MAFGNAEAMIIIEEKRGKNFYKLVLSPAPFNGGLIQDYKGDLPNSYSGYKKGEILPFWFKNNSWKFLAKGSKEWMKKNMPKIRQKINDETNNNSGQNNGNWEEVILEHQALKQQRFMSYHKIKILQGSPENGSPQEVVLRLEHLPVIPIREIPKPGTGEIQIIGNSEPTKVNSGFNTRGYEGGKRFGTLIHYNGPLREIKDFNFHIRHNQCKQIQFGLNFYKVSEGEVVGLINPAPLVFEIGPQKDWIRHPIPQGIKIDSDILVTLDVLAMNGKKKNIQGLFLSQANSKFKSEENRNLKEKWDFWAGNFAFYLTVVQ